MIHGLQSVEAEAEVVRGDRLPLALLLALALAFSEARLAPLAAPSAETSLHLGDGGGTHERSGPADHRSGNAPLQRPCLSSSVRPPSRPTGSSRELP